MDVLARIKRLVLQRRYQFSEKARAELESDNLLPSQVIESIVTARSISKTLRSRSPRRHHAGEKLYIIISFSFDGTPIYTKGKILRAANTETFYILISAKRDT